MKKEILQKVFLELIAINSLHPNEAEVSAYIEDYFMGHDVSFVKDDFGNIIAKTPGQGEPFLLSTHFDIPEDTPDAKHEIDGDIIRSTGENILGADPKSGLAVLMVLAAELAQSKDTYRPVEFVLTRGEEAGLVGARALDFSLVSAKEGLVLDQDGHMNEIISHAPCFILMDGEFVGKAAHPCEPEKGINALRIAVEAFAGVSWGFCREGISSNVGKIEGGTARNSIPGSVSFLAEIRGFDTQEALNEAKDVTAHFQAVAKKHGGIYKGEPELIFEGYQHEEKPNSLINRYSAFVNDLGLKANPFKTFGGSDAQIFNEHGIETITVGSGYYNAHQYSEYVDLQVMSEIHDHLLRWLKQ